MATDETDKVDNHDLLMEILEARETLEEADGQEVEELRQDNQAKVDDIVHQICELLHSKEPDLHAVKRLAVELRYGGEQWHLEPEKHPKQPTVPTVPDASHNVPPLRHTPPLSHVAAPSPQRLRFQLTIVHHHLDVSNLYSIHSSPAVLLTFFIDCSQDETHCRCQCGPFLTPQAPIDEDGFVVVSDDNSEENFSTPDNGPATPATPSPLSRQDIAEVFASSFTQLIRDSEVKAASQTAAVVASAVAKVRAELQRDIEALHATQVSLSLSLESVEIKAQQAERRAAEAEAQLEEMKDNCLCNGGNLSKTVCHLERRLDVTTNHCYDLERRMNSGDSLTVVQRNVNAVNLQTHKEETNKRLTALETRTKALEGTCETLEKRTAPPRFSSLPVAPTVQPIQPLSGFQGGADIALHRVEQRLNDDLRRKQEKLDSLSAQLKTERACSDSMFVKVAAMSLVLRGGPLPTEDGKVLQKVSSWLDRFKAKTSDPRLRERADGYITKINEKMVGTSTV
ncbi:hypothetical protein A1Q2_06803 [Trichosporon asahii var. asahii CBS 8904]|uniref:Co-chaperone HscB C-terminal oligomerisation domain-containing protein n=1 Tax=Trichosporon asahii var. asahii (strain CBS 8904) TaxID=1220162 RepID=K1VQ54_TRIAC|nr:hypothetical protein A1Q2_06803 [Trichosporon asahii var. asahii CBS 8904]